MIPIYSTNVLNDTYRSWQWKMLCSLNPILLGFLWQLNHLHSNFQHSSWSDRRPNTLLICKNQSTIFTKLSLASYLCHLNSFLSQITYVQTLPYTLKFSACSISSLPFRCDQRLWKYSINNSNVTKIGITLECPTNALNFSSTCLRVRVFFCQMCEKMKNK